MLWHVFRFKKLSFSNHLFFFFLCFSKTIPGKRFRKILVPILPPPVGLGAIFDFRYFQKGSFGIQFRHKGFKRRSTPNEPGCPWCDPALPQTMVIIMLLGPTGFENVIVWIEMCSFVAFPVSRCGIFYLFVTLFHKTTVNAEPLSPPICERINPHFFK